MLAHVFEDATRCRHVVHLPPTAAIHAQPGAMLKAGERWCMVLPEVPAAWRHRSGHERWATLGEACGGSSLVGRLQQAWFQAQGLRLSARPGLAFYPSALVAPAVRDVPPLELWWDLAPAEAYTTNERGLDAAVFPPIPLRRWDDLRLDLCGIDVDAGIGDPRFAAAQREAGTGRRCPLGLAAAGIRRRLVANSPRPARVA